MEQLGRILSFVVVMLCAAGFKSCVSDHGFFWENRTSPPAIAAPPPVRPWERTYGPTEALADYGPQTSLDSGFDDQSRGNRCDANGNCYSWSTDATGRTTVNGSNARTGSLWTNYIEPDGRQRGTDADGNLWSYDNQTQIYSNTNGTFCTGEGALRTCTGGD